MVCRLRSDVPVAYVRRALTNRFVSQRRSPAVRHASQSELPDAWDGRDLSEAVAVRRTIWQLLGTLPEKQRAAVVGYLATATAEGSVR